MRFSKVCILCVFILVFLLRVPFFSVPLDYDEGTYAFFAFFSKGEKFYSSMPIARLPGIIFTYRFLDDLFPGQIAAFRIAAALLIALATLGIYQLGKLLYNQRVGVFSALIFALFSSQISVDSPANTEFFMVPFTLWSFYLFLAFQKSKKLTWLASSGFLAGVAIFYKQVAIFEMFLLGLWLLVENFEDGVKAKSLVRQGIFWGIPFLTPFLSSLLYFLLQGEAADFWWQSFESGGGYWVNAWRGREWFGRLSNSLGFLWRTYWPFWVVSVGGLIRTLERRRKEDIFLLLWLVLALVGASFNGWFFPHYFVQIISALSLLGGIFLGRVVRWERGSLSTFAVFVLFYLMLKPCLPYYLSYWQLIQGRINKVEYLERVGFDVKDAGWLPFYESADYLREKMKKEDSLFVWGSTPLPYYLTRKYPTTSSVYNYPLLDYQFMLPTYKGWRFDFEANRQKLMSELTANPPDYILIHVNPEQIFDQMMLFEDFGTLVSYHYAFDRQFGNLLILKRREGREFEEVVPSPIPFELLKRFSAIIEVEAKEGQTDITFEPMVNPRGILRTIKTAYPAYIKIDFEPLSVRFLGQDGYDFVSWSSSNPSGIFDLHLRVEVVEKPFSFVRVKMEEITWNSRSYGVNPPLKTIQSGGVLDLFLEAPPNWREGTFEVYLIYEDGSLARETLCLSAACRP